MNLQRLHQLWEVCCLLPAGSFGYLRCKNQGRVIKWALVLGIPLTLGVLHCLYVIPVDMRLLSMINVANFRNFFVNGSYWCFNRFSYFRLLVMFRLWFAKKQRNKKTNRQSVTMFNRPIAITTCQQAVCIEANRRVCKLNLPLFLSVNLLESAELERRQLLLKLSLPCETWCWKVKNSLISTFWHCFTF